MSAEPSGFVIESLAEQQAELPIVTPLALRLTRCPGMPSNVSRRVLARHRADADGD